MKRTRQPCVQCKRMFNAQWNYTQKRWAQFCDRKCAGKSRIGKSFTSNNPQPEILPLTADVAVEFILEMYKASLLDLSTTQAALLQILNR